MRTDYENLTLYLASSIHEIKNAFSRLQSMTDSLILNIPEEYRHNTDYHKIQFESQHINTQLTQLLVTYKNNEMGYQAYLEDVIMDDYIEEILRRHQKTLSMLNVNIETSVEPNLVSVIDERLVTNVIDTLIYNATQAKAKKIKLSVFCEKQYMVIQVEDDGPGFTDLDTNQADSETDSEIEQPKQKDLLATNTGLGLLFARQITEMHKTKDLQGHTLLGKSGELNGAKVKLCFPA